MTGSNWRTYVERKFKRTDKATELYEATTEIIADMRRRFISDTYSEEAYIASIDTAGEYRLAVPSDLGYFIGSITVTDTASDDTYKPLEKISKERYDELYHNRLHTDTSKMNTGLPKHFCIYGGQVFIGPVPDLTTYRFYCNFTTEAFTDVTSSTTDVPFSGKERNVLRSGVLMELHDGMENYEEGNYWRSKYLSDLNAIAEVDNYNRAENELMQYHGI